MLWQLRAISFTMHSLELRVDNELYKKGLNLSPGLLGVMPRTDNALGLIARQVQKIVFSNAALVLLLAPVHPTLLASLLSHLCLLEGSANA